MGHTAMSKTTNTATGRATALYAPEMCIRDRCMVALTKVLGSNSARFFIAQQRELGVVEGPIEEVMGGQKVVKRCV